MPATGSRWPNDRDTLSSISDHSIFQSMLAFFATVIMFLFAGVGGPATRPFGSVNDNLLFFISIFWVILGGFEVPMG